MFSITDCVAIVIILTMITLMCRKCEDWWKFVSIVDDILAYLSTVICLVFGEEIDEYIKIVIMEIF